MKLSRGKCLSVLGVVAVLWACNQAGLGVGTAVSNLASAPLDGLRGVGNFLTGKTYSNYTKKTATLRVELPQTCTTAGSHAGQAIRILDPAMRATLGSACKCAPWGDCPRNLCDCKALCPDSFDILSVHADRLPGAPAHGLVFQNDPDFFAGTRHPMVQGGGYCWGHASVTSKFNRLGFFDPGHELTAPRSSKEWRNFYSRVIDDVTDNKATQIPGFSNLAEFSSHPTIQEMLAEKVAKEWAGKAMKLGTLGIAMKDGQMSPDTAQKLVTDVAERVKNHQAPQIAFTFGRKFSTHIVIVSSVHAQSNGSHVFCLKDSNFSASQNQRCRRHIVIGADGSASGSDYGAIGGIEVASNEDSDTVAQISSLVKRCRGERGC